jgi:peptidoglycan L-alanyl-D-glutamate endopeptidase CwlK
MNEPTPIPGNLSLSDLATSLTSYEVSGFKFDSATIQGNVNMVVFVPSQLPPRLNLVLKGAPPPSGTTRSWGGKLRVAGKDTDVEIYRGAAAFAEPSGDIVSQIEQVQSALSLKVDGAPGPRTWSAITEALQLPPISEVKLTNERSEAVIDTLLPHVRPFARALYFKAQEHGITMSLISGTRTYAEQDRLYDIGRTTGKKGEIVTKARGGYSNHNFGIAFDVGVFKGNKYLEDAASYLAVGVLGEEVGLEWGGRWKRFPDASHFQLRPAWASGMSESAMLARLRAETPGGVLIPKGVLTLMAKQTKSVNDGKPACYC